MRSGSDRSNRSFERVDGTLLKKLELLMEGEVHIPKHVKLPVLPIKSSGGPTSTRPHFIIGFESTRVKVAIGSKRSRFELSKGDRGFAVLDRKRPFLEDVRIVPATMHAPEQVFVNIQPDCSMGCLFCSAGVDRPIHWSPDRWIDVMVRACKKDGVDSVAITAGMPDVPEKMVDDMVAIMLGVKAKIKGVTIGVEPNALSEDLLKRLRKGGARELKINVQAASQEIFDRVCPRLDRDAVLTSLRHGVRVFGKNRVTSNLIIGLGETDEEVLDCIESLAMMGVVPTLRVLRINEVNREPLERSLGTMSGISDPERVHHLFKGHRAVLERYGLDPRTFRTMCHSCGCCDLTVGMDF